LFPGDKPLTISFEVIARVVSVRPLVFEILDSSEDQWGGLAACGIVRIYSVDARLRDVLPQLRFRDLVKARLACADGGIVQTILTEVKKIPGEPVYFHERPPSAGCSSRIGVLVAYRKRNLEALTVYRDGLLRYSDGYGNTAGRQQLGREELARLMRAFRDAGFNFLPSTLPPIDETQGRSSITLICGRHQRVLVSGRETLLAPVLTALEGIRAGALSNSRYLLRYQEKREISLLDWPFAQVPVEQLETLKRRAQVAEYEARQANRAAHGPFEVIREEVPPEFLAKLPGTAAVTTPGDDPNRYVYVRADSKTYRVIRTCVTGSPQCRTFEGLMVQEVPDAGVLLATTPASVVSEDQFVSSRLTGMIYGILWPPRAGIALGEVPANGRPISNEEYAQHQPLFREVFTAGPSGLGLIEGRYFYQGVRIALDERGRQ
jgi:hypothetical protein